MNKRKKGFPVLTIALLIALLALPAMAMAKADLVVVTDAPPKSMNPHAFSSDANLSYMSNFFDGLLQRPAPDGILSPALAVKWQRLDALTWKFELRKGVKFHNGNAFTAADVKFTFDRLTKPGLRYRHHGYACGAGCIELAQEPVEIRRSLHGISSR